MKCPLLKIARAGLESQAARPQDECLKEECAWWNEHFGMCSQAVAAFHEGVLDRARERDAARRDRL